jgi:hypothetical protein
MERRYVMIESGVSHVMRSSSVVGIEDALASVCITADGAVGPPDSSDLLSATASHNRVCEISTRYCFGNEAGRLEPVLQIAAPRLRLASARVPSALAAVLDQRVRSVRRGVAETDKIGADCAARALVARSADAVRASVSVRYLS